MTCDPRDRPMDAWGLDRQERAAAEPPRARHEWRFKALPWLRECETRGLTKMPFSGIGAYG